MDGSLVYASLQGAVDKLVKVANTLDDPIDLYVKQQSQLGEYGASAWGGTASSEVQPIIDAIKADILELQAISREFSDKVHAASENYAQADVTATKEVTGIKFSENR